MVYRPDGATGRELRPHRESSKRSLRAGWGRTIAEPGRAGGEPVAVDATGLYVKRPLSPGQHPPSRPRPAPVRPAPGSEVAALRTS